MIECDPSIKSIIVNIDSDSHEFIIEDLDEERVVVKENMVALLKQKLEDVRATLSATEKCYIRGGLASVICPFCPTFTNVVPETQREPPA